MEKKRIASLALALMLLTLPFTAQALGLGTSDSISRILSPGNSAMVDSYPLPYASG